MFCMKFSVITNFFIKLFITLFMIETSFAISCDFDQQVKTLQEKIKASRQILDKKFLENPEIVKRHLEIMTNLDQETRKLFINHIHNPTAVKILKEWITFI